MSKSFYPLIALDFHDEAKSIALIRMQADETNNALTPSFVKLLEDLIAQAVSTQSLKVIVFLGLDNVFCAGADLETLKSLNQERLHPTDILLSKSILDIPVPTIAAMAGHAVGGGLALGLAMDIILISKESRYGCSFMNMGFTPGMGITKLLENVLSKPMSHELMYSGEYRKGETFVGCSGFNYILNKAEVLNKALDIAMQISEKTKKTLEVLKGYLSLEKKRLFQETYAVETMMHNISFCQPELKTMLEENYVK